jgi:hypothetical protein
MMRWFIAAATAFWGIWTWSFERRQTRTLDRTRLTALYVNPFLSACEDLQSRIYNILELEGLRSLRKRYPDGSYAEETLYLIVRYFGWGAAVHRYGPHTQDPEVVRLMEAVANSFATVKYPVGPFAFFRPEQKALGKLIMTRFEGQFGVELDTISYYSFKNQLTQPPLAESEAVKQSLEALRKAKSAKSLAGWARLAEVQNYLVDLLEYLEGREGFSLFPGQRKKCTGPNQQEASVTATA